MKKTPFIYLFLMAGLLPALPAGAQPLTLEECRESAVEHNRTLRNSRFDLEAALQTRREAFTNYFPQISASGGAFQAQHGLVQADFGMTVPQIGTMNLPISMVKRGVFGSVTAVQPLFAGLKIVNGNKLARLGEEVGELQLRKTESEVREQTDTYYWQIVSLKDNLLTLDAVERQLGEIYRQVELSVKAGLVTTNDLLRVELRQQEVASNRLKVENSLKVVKLLLAQHIGVDWREFDIATENFAEPEAPGTYYVCVEEALDRRAEYLLAEKNVEAQKYQKRMERGKYLPTVGVGAGYLYYNMTDKNVDDGMVFAQVSVPISEWWGGSHALKKARLREQQAENDRLQARELLAVEIEKTWNEVQEAYAQIMISRRSVSSATENLRENRAFYQAGTASLTDLLDAETLYTQSCNNYTAACAAYRTSLARYMRVTGR
ncbi:MAG TPA: TolC family protein [Candidatus Alistipes intestinipullorum]|nr:TolC family protein [Candidatus Alistipes intestinipullorum]